MDQQEQEVTRIILPDSRYLTSIRKSRLVTVDGKQQMLATSFDENGNLSSLGNSNSSGAEHGFWQYYFPNGELKAEGSLSNGKKVGKWKYYTPTDSLNQLRITRMAQSTVRI
jgi:antitoxin component YwqK of YwqJK toxin-antitoxin module